MKKILILLFFILIQFRTPVLANVLVKNLGDTIISANQIARQIQVQEDSFISLQFIIKVRTLDPFISNSSNPNYKIPINQLYLNDGENEFQMQPNSEFTLLSMSGLQFWGYTKNYNCIIKNIGVLPPGNYSTRLQFQTQTALFTYNTVYNLSFTIPTTQEVSSITNPVNIKLTPDNVFETNISISNVTSPQILIKSNDKWKLILDTSNLGNLIGKYYFQVTGVSKNVTEYESSQIEILPNKQYVIAKGNPTVTELMTGNYSTDYVNVKYSLKNPSDKYLKEGQFKNYVNYIIQSGSN